MRTRSPAWVARTTRASSCPSPTRRACCPTSVALSTQPAEFVERQRGEHHRAAGQGRGGGRLARAEPGPERAEDDFEQAEQRDLRRGQGAARDDEQHARQRELEEAEERQ